MTDDRAIWAALQRHVPKRTWLSFDEILATVRSRMFLDTEDLERAGAHSGTPRWESNLRHVLRSKTQAGAVRSRRRSQGGG